MRQSRTKRIREPMLWVHGVAGGLALWFAWWISGTPYVQTAVQFVGPAAVILIVHLAWLGLSGRLVPGFSSKVFARALGSSGGMALLLFLGSATLPRQAHADFGNVVQTGLVSLFCIVVLLAVGAIVYLVFWLVLKVANSGVRAVRGADDDPETRFFDFGAVGVAALLMVATGLEGLPNTYRFPTGDRALKTLEIAASSNHVWKVMESATTPDVPLPAILGSFPKPVEVSVDEGTVLGAQREVMFAGREGAGVLHLKVTERTNYRVVFTVQSDTSPYAQWISFEALTYSVRETDAGSLLTVSLAYDRELSPSWFFGPMMRGAAFFAVGVLAGDVKARAET